MTKEDLGMKMQDRIRTRLSDHHIVAGCEAPYAEAAQVVGLCDLSKALTSLAASRKIHRVHLYTSERLPVFIRDVPGNDASPREGDGGRKCLPVRELNGLAGIARAGSVRSFRAKRHAEILRRILTR